MFDFKYLHHLSIFFVFKRENKKINTKIIYLLQKNCTIFVKYEMLKKVPRFALFKNGLESVFIQGSSII